MMNTWDKFVKGGAAILGALAGILGEWNIMLSVLAWFMVLDYVSGLAVAWRGKSPKTENGGVSSKAGFDGLIKKGFIILIVLAATLLDRAIGAETMVFQTATTCYYIANEGISLLENAGLMGVSYPPVIKKALEALKKKGEDEPPDVNT